jgi:hypothetical protein
MKLQPCHKMLADIYIRFGDGRKLKTHLMGPNDWERMGESLWQHTNWVNKIVRLEMMSTAAQIGGDRKWQAEIAAEMARIMLNLEGAK